MYCELHEHDRSAITCHNFENNKDLFVIDGYHFILYVMMTVYLEEGQMFACSDKLYERLHLLNAGFPQVAAFVNKFCIPYFVRPLTQTRSAAWLGGNMTLCYFVH